MKKILFFSAMFFVFMPLLKAQDIKSKLAFYLPCDSSKYIDEAGKVEGTVKGILSSEIGFDDKSEGALYFDGTTSSIDFIDANILNLPLGSSVRTLALWVRTTMTTGTCDLISYGTQEKGQHNHFAYRPAEGKFRSGHWWADYDWSTTLNDDVWHHVAVVYTETECTLYVDGIKLDSKQIIASPAFNTIANGVFRIGARNNPEAGDKFNGFLDEVRVYQRALTEADIVALYNYKPRSGDITSKLAFYLPCGGESFVEQAGKVEGTANGIITSDIGFDEKPNGSWYFDGFTNAIDFVDANIINLPLGSSVRTLALWLKTTMTTGDCDLISYGTTAKGQHNHFAFRSGEGRIRSGHWYADYDWNVTVNDDIWHHVAVSYTDTECTLYLDGIKLETKTLTTDPETALNTVSNGLLRIGARNGTLYDFFTGYLDEVRIYNRTLSQQDVTALFEYRPQGPSKVATLNSDNFKVYPTLVESTLNISSNMAISSLYVFDMSGKIVQQSKMQNNIDVSNLPNGIYFIKGIGAKQSYSAKFIKK